MKNILIFIPENKIKSTGGPEGYIYNLKKGLSQMESEDVEVSYLPSYTEPKNLQSRKKLADKLPRPIKGLIKIFYCLRQYRAMDLGEKQTDIDLNQFDAVHFHYSFDLFKNKEVLKKYKGKVIFTTHSPKPYFLEYIDKVYDLLPLKTVYMILRKFEKIDRYAFECADYVIFPCEEAEEPYINNWKYYADFKKNKTNVQKYKYLLTGVTKKKAKIDGETIRKKYNIPDDAFVVVYVGRHNHVKGYDLLKMIGSECIRINPNIYFLCAGKEYPWHGIKSKNWIEVGWTDDPYSIIAAGDIFVLPNRETYFDIVLLEVLSLGKRVLISDTSGNKHFKKYKTNSIHFFRTNSEAVNAIAELASQAHSGAASQESIDLFHKHFDEKTFAKNYVTILKEILGK